MIWPTASQKLAVMNSSMETSQRESKRPIVSEDNRPDS